MIALRLLSLAATGVVLAACATTPPPPSGPPPVLVKLRSMGIDNITYEKIANHRILTYTDIFSLLKSKVPSPVILTYIKSTKAPYTFTNAQLEQLDDAGASGDLLNYLGKSTGFFVATERDQTGGAGKWKDNPYFADPYYMGAAPFGYMWPGEWYDPDFVDAMF